MNVNVSRSLRSLILLSAIAVFAGCATSTISRIDSNRAAYDSWPLDVQEAVLSNRVKPGMTPDQVRMSVGNPSQVVNRGVQAGEDEVWVYKKGGSLLSNTGVSLGTSIGGVGVSSGTSGSGSSNAEEQEVVFRNGVVSRSDFP